LPFGFVACALLGGPVACALLGGSSRKKSFGAVISIAVSVGIRIFVRRFGCVGLWKCESGSGASLGACVLAVIARLLLGPVPWSPLSDRLVIERWWASGHGVSGQGRGNVCAESVLR
jgi:hypothetical protein